MSARTVLGAISSAVSPLGFVASPVLSTEETRTSSALSWKGLSLERYVSQPGRDMAPNMTEHAIWRMLSTSALGQRSASCDCNVSIRVLKSCGSRTAAPVDRINSAAAQTGIDWTHCEVDHVLIHKVAKEIGYRHNTDLPFNTNPQDSTIEMIVGLLATEMDLGGTSGALYTDSLAHALAVRLLLLPNTSGHAVAAAYGVSFLPPKALKRVKERIEDELGCVLSLDALAEESGYSRTHFLRMFRSATGLTPHQYVLARRVRRAQDLLQRTQAPLAEVAVECGFSSQSHMTDVFRTRVGVTPFEHRRSP